MEYGKVPKIWSNSTIFILGNGPSLELLIDNYHILADQKVILVNSAVYLDKEREGALLFFSDAKWYWWNKKYVDSYWGLKITLNKFVKGREKSIEDEPGLMILQNRKIRGIETDPHYLSWNRSSGGAAVNLAYHLGAKRIVLFGFDMRLVDGRKNCFPNDQEQTKRDPYLNMASSTIWGVIRERLNSLEVEIVNATPNSGISEEDISRTTLEEELCRV